MIVIEPDLYVLVTSISPAVSKAEPEGEILGIIYAISVVIAGLFEPVRENSALEAVVLFTKTWILPVSPCIGDSNAAFT